MFATLTSEFREMALEQLRFRELLLQITLRDLRVRYKQTIMGFGWAMFVPLVNTAVFSVIFMRVAPLDTGMPYPLFAYCGLLTWNFSAAAFRWSANRCAQPSNPRCDVSRWRCSRPARGFGWPPWVKLQCRRAR